MSRRRGRWRRGARAALLLAAAVFGGAPRAAEAQPKWKTGSSQEIDAAKLARAIREKAVGPHHPEEVDPVSRLVNVYIRKGDYAQAEALAQRELSLRWKALGPDHIAVATALDSLAGVYKAKGEYARAEPLSLRALSIAEKALGADHPRVAEALDHLAMLYKAKGEYARAESLLQRALSSLEKALGPDHPVVATALSDLASVYGAKGEDARAEPLFLRSLSIVEKALGPDDPQVAAALNNLGTAYESKGEYARAELLYQRALSIVEKALGPDHPQVAIALSNLGAAYESKGEYARAEHLLQRALTIQEKALGPDHLGMAHALQNLANVYIMKREYARAEPLLQRALTIQEKVLDPNHPKMAMVLDIFATMYILKGEHARAEPLLQRALSIFEKALGPDNPLVARTLAHLGAAYQAKGDYAHAESMIQRALSIFEKTLAPDHPNVANTWSLLTMLAEAQEDYPRALAAAERAEGIREKNLGYMLTAGAESQKRAYLATIDGFVKHDLWRAVHTGDRRAERLALTALLRRKGRALDATADSMRILRGKLGAEEQALFDELMAVRSKRSTLALRGPDAMPLDQYRQVLADLEGKDQQIEGQISERSATFRANEQPITLAAVKAALPEGSALVEWSIYRTFHPKAFAAQGFLGHARYAACVLPSGGEPRCVDLGDVVAIEASVHRLRQALGRAASNDVQALARDLDGKVMAPVRKLLGETRAVFLSPDRVLNLIPFAALVDEDGHYLIERYAFTYLTSGRDLLRLRADNPPPRERPMVIAAPDFDAEGPAARGSDDRERGVRSVDLAGMTFSPLPGTKREAEALAAQIGDARVLVDGEATEGALKALRGPSLLHIATHGFFLREEEQPAAEVQPSFREDPLLRAGLAFAGANGRKSRADDGVLTALEVSGVDLHGTQLVVLSACETGLGEVRTGDGVYGLRRALFVAGARTQVMSLWRVDDEATQAMMKAYYQRLERGEGRSEAMRQVQLEMLSQQKTARPYYWASFIVSGDWTPLHGKPAERPALAPVHPGPRGCACTLGEADPAADPPWASLALGLALLVRRARRTSVQRAAEIR